MSSKWKKNHEAVAWVERQKHKDEYRGVIIFLIAVIIILIIIFK